MDTQFLKTKGRLRSTSALVATAFFLFDPSLGQAQDAAATSEMVVQGTRIFTPNTTITDPADAKAIPYRDGGELLRSLPGVSGGRMGGHGLDPTIRGQSANQLNIIDDGAFTFGGCPNRMDPPSSLLNLDAADSVEVVKGYQSVQNGPGGSGGTVKVTRAAPTFAEDEMFKGEIGAGYDGNGSMWSGSARGTMSLGEAFVRGGGSAKDSGNYDDGAGRAVRSSFTQKGGDLEFGWAASGGLLSFGYQYDRVDDALYAGASMDGPLDETNSFRLKGERSDLNGDVVKGYRFNAYATLLEHVMDNYSLRTATGMKMETPSSSDTWGGTLAADMAWGQTPVTLGLDVQSNNREANRYVNASSANLVSEANLNSTIWPDVTIRQVGLFGEGAIPLSDVSNLKVGLRYDNVDANHGAADKATKQSTGTYTTANDLYQAFYGQTATDQTENNVGGLVRYETKLGAFDAFAGASRSVRTADATERGIATKPMGTSGGWVGNPNIDPEQHHQVDLGLSREESGWSFGVSTYYDRVNDYILRDSARGQAGILMTNQGTVYRNVTAELAGFEANVSVELASFLTLSGNAAYTYGENLDDDRALAQMPPLQGDVTLAYAPMDWSLGTRLRWAATQGNVDMSTDTGSGQDTAETSGYAVLDLFGDYQITETASISGGVSNLLDRTYADHLNTSSTFDTTVSQVNEPGRSLYIRGKIAF